MKKAITILVACVLLSTLFAAAAIPASAKKDKSFSYISMTLAPELKGQDQFVCWVIPWDDIFEDGKTYTLYATAMFENIEPNGGCAYINMYSYDSLDAAMTTDWNHLVQFKDYAKYPADDGSTKLGEWTDFEYTGDFSEVLYGGFQGPKTGNKAKLEAVWISIGFYLSTGTINVRELGVKDDSGKIIYNQTFENGLDFDEPYFRHTNDITPETEGETWSILKSDEKKEESSEEPEPIESSDEPEPVESSDEPEPIVESSDEPEPVESSDEPAPVESSEEPAPAESSEEPAPAEESSEAPIAESTPAESSQTPAQSEGPGAWLWILIGAVAFAIILAVVLVLIMKKKKA